MDLRVGTISFDLFNNAFEFPIIHKKKIIEKKNKFYDIEGWNLY